MDDRHEIPESGETARTRLDSRLSEAKVAATSPKGIVKVVYNGHGHGVSLELKAGAKRQYEAASMAGFVTAALRAADRALDALHQHAFDDLSGDGATLARYRTDKPTAGMDVARCFGRTEP